jgi:hypothetical protein
VRPPATFSSSLAVSGLRVLVALVVRAQEPLRPLLALVDLAAEPPASLLVGDLPGLFDTLVRSGQRSRLWLRAASAGIRRDHGLVRRQAPDLTVNPLKALASSQIDNDSVATFLNNQLRHYFLPQIVRKAT